MAKALIRFAASRDSWKYGCRDDLPVVLGGPIRRFPERFRALRLVQTDRVPAEEFGAFEVGIVVGHELLAPPFLACRFSWCPSIVIEGSGRNKGLYCTREEMVGVGVPA